MRLGVFGGSFDPVHNGHLFVAEAVREACALDRILFVPTREGKHYRNGALSASPHDRALANLKVALVNLDRLHFDAAHTVLTDEEPIAPSPVPRSVSTTIVVPAGRPAPGPGPRPAPPSTSTRCAARASARSPRPR